MRRMKGNFIMDTIIKKHCLTYILALILSIGSAVLLSLFSVRLGAVIDVVVKHEPDFFSKILACFKLVTGWFIVSLLFSYMKSKNVSDIIKDVKKNLYVSVHTQEMNDYVSRPNEYYLNTFTKNIDLLQTNYLSPRCEIVANFISALLSIGTIFFISWKLGLSFVGISLVTIVLSQLPGLIMTKKTNEFSKESADYLKVINNHLKGFEQIKLLGLSDVFLKKYLNRDNQYEKSRLSYIFVSIFANYLGSFFSFFAQLACMSIGVWFALRGEITVGLLIAAVNLLNGVFNPLQQLAYNKNLMGTVRDIKKGFDEILSTEKKEGKLIQDNISSIGIKDLDFKFADDKVIFKNFTVRFEKGKSYAIIGESGRGKSTLAKLIMKYYGSDKYKGKIQLNNKDIHDILSDDLYKKVAYIQRNDFYIDGSVKDNIELYRKTKSNEKLYKKLKFTDSFLDKSIEEGSRSQVSTGEKQRIDIARFLVEDYDVMIFDEPTSNLDKETSEIIFDLIFGIKDKIVIVITHVNDEDTLSSFDQVIRL